MRSKASVTRLALVLLVVGVGVAVVAGEDGTFATGLLVTVLILACAATGFWLADVWTRRDAQARARRLRRKP